MGLATKSKTKKSYAKEWSKRHILLSHFFIFYHKPKRMLKFLGNGFWIVIVQKIRKKCLSHSGKMHFSVSGHVTLGMVRWRHELHLICPLWVLSKFGPTEACMCRVIANWFFPSNGIKRYFNGPLNVNRIITCSCMQMFLLPFLCIWWLLKIRIEGQTVYRKPQRKVTKLKSKFYFFLG